MSLTRMNPNTAPKPQNKANKNAKRNEPSLLSPLPTFSSSFKPLSELLENFDDDGSSKKSSHKRKPPASKPPKKRKKVSPASPPQDHTAVTVQIPSIQPMQNKRKKKSGRGSSQNLPGWQTQEKMGMKKDRMQALHLVPQRDIAEMHGTMFNIYLVGLILMIWRLLRTLVDQSQRGANAVSGFWKSEAVRLEGCKLVVKFIGSDSSSDSVWVPPFGESAELKKFTFSQLKAGAVGFAARMKGNEDKLWNLVKSMRSYLDQRKRYVFENAMKSLFAVLQKTKSELISKWIHKLPTREKALQEFLMLLAEKLNLKDGLTKLLVKYGSIWSCKMERMLPGLVEYYAQNLKGIDLRDEFVNLYEKVSAMNDQLYDVEDTQIITSQDMYDWSDL